MKRFDISFVLARIPLDFVAAFAAWWLARTVRPYTDLVPYLHVWFDPKFVPDASFFLPFSLASAGAFIVILALLKAYRCEDPPGWSEDLRNLTLGSIFWGMALVSFFALAYREPIFSRMMLAQAMVFVIIFAILVRVGLHYVKKTFWQAGLGTSRIALLGSDKARKEFRLLIATTPRFQLVSETQEIGGIKVRHVDEIWHVDHELAGEREQQLRELCYREHKIFRFVPASSMAFARIEMLILEGTPLLYPISASLTGWGRIAKRGLDTLLSSLALIALSPFLLVLGLGVKLTSAGPMLYGSQRIGRDGKSFTMWKFRSMVADAEQRRSALSEDNHRADGPFFKIKNDPRITKFGKILRRFSLDELPQLWNVLIGDMSLVGSRPHFAEELEQIPSEFRRTLAMRPGLTGLAQTSGRSDLPFAREMELDLYYLEHWSVWLDLKILLKTMWVIVRGKGAD